MRAELWFFGDNDRIDVRDAQPAPRHQAANVFEEPQAIGALPFRIGIRKMSPDVAHPGRAEQSIANSMHQYVTIGMAHWPLIEGHLNAAKNKWPASRKPVQIVPDACAAQCRVAPTARS